MSGTDSGPSPRIVDLIFDRRRRISRFLPAVVVAVSAGYAAAGAAVLHWGPTVHQATDRPIVTELPVDIAGALPPPPIVSKREPIGARVARPARTTPTVPTGSVAPASEEPAAVPAPVGNDTSGPIDMTDSVVIVGKGIGLPNGGSGATAYPAATRTGAGANGPRAQTTDPLSRARPVALEQSQWRCPWPQRAESAERQEEDVLIKVTVESDGHAVSALVLRDPGLGFGQAAIDCALTTRFQPALNAAGVAIRAESPPIRVRFTR